MSDVLYNQIKSIASQLTPIEMVRLAGWLEAAADMSFRERGQSPTKPTHLKDHYGNWSEVRVSDNDIEEVRRDMFLHHPR